jgi:hypothetical protein
MRIQITLTSPEGKRIIAKGIKAHPLVQRVRKRGKIILKGGTTISAVSEELCGRPMKISGMITPREPSLPYSSTKAPFPTVSFSRGSKLFPLILRKLGRKKPLI